MNEFMAAPCFSWAFSGGGEQGLLFVVVHRLLVVVASRCGRTWALGAQASVVGVQGPQSKLSSHGAEP